MWPVVLEALEQWGDDVARVEPLAGGVANDMWSVRVNGHLAVGRLGARSDADLAWETELLQHLDREGLTVPVPIPTTDGRLFADGLVVMTYVEGGPPETEADWRRVADTLRQLHRLTHGWPQRPGWRSSTDLLHADQHQEQLALGLGREAVQVHGVVAHDQMGEQATLLAGGGHEAGRRREWRDMPSGEAEGERDAARGLHDVDDGAHDIAAQASAAWEAAVRWDDEYAVTRLAEVREV